MKLKTYIINLEKDKEKRTTILNQLLLQPLLDFEFLDAVYGPDLNENQISAIVSPTFYSSGCSKHSLCEVGCALSHLKVYEKMIISDIPYAMVLEDDAILPPPSYMVFQSLKPMLESNRPIVIQLSCRWQYKLSNFVQDVENNRQLYRLFGSSNAVAYLINKNGAKLLHDNLFPIRFVADNWGEFVRNFNLQTYGIHPRLVTYPDGYGEVGKSTLYSKTANNTSLKITNLLLKLYSKVHGACRYIIGYRTCYKNRDVPPFV